MNTDAMLFPQGEAGLPGAPGFPGVRGEKGEQVSGGSFFPPRTPCLCAWKAAPFGVSPLGVMGILAGI